MNYVAHLYLTHPDKDLTLGNLMGDLLANNVVGELSPVYQKGVRIHRFIDSYTDNHPSLDEARRMLRERHRKYAPVVLDLLLDFILVDEWGTYSTETFDSFQQWVYNTITSSVHKLPQSAAIRLQHMAHGRWLNSYTNEDRFQKVLNRMDGRARFNSKFSEAHVDLKDHRDLLGAALRELMHSLQPKVDELMEGFNLQSEAK